MKSLILTCLFFVTAVFLGGCDEEHEQPEMSMVFNKEISEDCLFWLERNDVGSELRAGTSGSCKTLSLDKYIHALDEALAKVVAMGLNKNNVESIYLNSYEGSKDMAELLIRTVNTSKTWKNECDANVVDDCFLKLTKEFSLFKRVTSLAAKRLSAEYKVSFKDVICVSKGDVAKNYKIPERDLIKDCYPLAFGLAVLEKEEKVSE